MQKILVVEDEPLIRLSLIDALEDAGFQVIEAGSADDAVSMLEDQTIQFLFTDIQMPGKLSGIDLAHSVAERFPAAGIIVASGRIQPQDVSLPSGAAFFAKPYSFTDIIGQLHAWSAPQA